MGRIIYKDRSLQGLTQGSIISGLELARYNAYPVWGLIITPRCDLARGISVETIHILPIVDFESWYEIEGKILLVSKYKSNLKNKINKKIPKDFINGDIFESGFTNSELKELFENLEDNQTRSVLLDWMGQLDKEKEDLMNNIKNEMRSSLLENLISDKEQRFYLIEDWEKSNSIKIILLREIISISKDIAIKYKNGFVETELEKSILSANNLRISSGKDLNYEIIKEIRSPYIEHIMQRFAYNFTRIGVADRASTIINHIKQKLTDTND